MAKTPTEFVVNNLNEQILDSKLMPIPIQLLESERLATQYLEGMGAQIGAEDKKTIQTLINESKEIREALIKKIEANLKSSDMTSMNRLTLNAHKILAEKKYDQPIRSFEELKKRHEHMTWSYLDTGPSLEDSQNTEMNRPRVTILDTDRHILEEKYNEYYNKLNDLANALVHKNEPAYQQASLVVTELSKKTHPNGQFKSGVVTDADLIKLTIICSHVAAGLKLINQKPPTEIKCNLYHGLEGEEINVAYNLGKHEKTMKELADITMTLEGRGWKKMRTALLILASVLLIACGIAAALPTGGVSVLASVGAVAALTAGAGLFVGRDTGLHKAVHDVKVKLDEIKKSDESDADKTSKTQDGMEPM